MTIVPVLLSGMKTEPCLPPGNLSLRTHHTYCINYSSVVISTHAAYIRVAVSNLGWRTCILTEVSGNIPVLPRK
jgi:hypothetical protein